MMDARRAIEILSTETPTYIIERPTHRQIHEALAYAFFGSAPTNDISGLEMKIEHMQLHDSLGYISGVWMPPGLPAAALTFEGHWDHHERLRLEALEWLAS